MADNTTRSLNARNPAQGPDRRWLRQLQAGSHRHRIIQEMEGNRAPDPCIGILGRTFENASD